MRIGVVGAGAVGGYFGGRLVEKGADVTFLVREKRQDQLKAEGLTIHSPQGNVTLPVSSLTANQKAEPFDVIILAVKAYHLPETMKTMQRYMDEHTVILPLLNGYQHIEILQKQFGAKNILGGFCYIEITLNEQGEICHLSDIHRLVYGELNGQTSERIERLQEMFKGAHFEAILSPFIITEMWNKYMFISALSGMTSLMRSSIGEIFSTDYGRELFLQLAREIYEVAIRQSLPKPPKKPEEILKRAESLLYSSTSSMYRDLQQGLPIETNHFHGSLLRWGRELGLHLPILTTIYTTLSLYQRANN